VNNTLTSISGKIQKQPIVLFACFWLLTFIVYLPAVKAGWVMDASWLVYYYRHQTFLEFINRVHSPTPSLYQFTQIVIYLFFKVFDTNVYMWHLVHVTLHAINSYLLYIICNRVLKASGVEKHHQIVLSGLILYIICPHISEVIVWEASYHYVQGFCLILLSMYLVQKYHYNQRAKYAWISGVLYFFATYSLEVFYLTPWFILSIAIFYRFALNYSKETFRKALLYFFLPSLLMFLMHLAVLSAVFAHFAHLPDSVIQPVSSYLCKPPKFIFHILFMGRYFPRDAQKMVYDLCESHWFQILFYGGTILCVAGTYKIRKRLSPKWKPGMLLFTWIVLSIIIITPLTFPMSGMLMFYDRYLYLLSAFVFLLVAMLLSNVRNSYLRTLILVTIGIIQYKFTYEVNLYWKHSAYINNRLLSELPPLEDKTVLLLNIPENMHGIGMIGAQPEGEFKRMEATFKGHILPNKIHDVASYNMVTRNDGAHITVINDSMVRVTLNQWGTWWWYEGQGGHSYETEDYKVNMVDVGHMYDLTLKHPASTYKLLYSHGDRWEVADMSKINEDQY
jgi:hypothetical protein